MYALYFYGVFDACNLISLIKLLNQEDSFIFDTFRDTLKLAYGYGGGCGILKEFSLKYKNITHRDTELYAQVYKTCQKKQNSVVVKIRCFSLDFSLILIGNTSSQWWTKFVLHNSLSLVLKALIAETAEVV